MSTTLLSSAPVGWTQDMFAHETARGFEDLFRTHRATAMCGEDGVLLVRVTQDDNGPYWGWWDAGQQEVCMIFRSQMILEVCFMYGSKAAEESGEGRVTRVRIERI